MMTQLIKMLLYFFYCTKKLIKTVQTNFNLKLEIHFTVVKKNNQKTQKTNKL